MAKLMKWADTKAYVKVKEELIKRSLDTFNSGLSEEDRKRVLMIDKKSLEKYIIKKTGRLMKAGRKAPDFS